MVRDMGSLVLLLAILGVLGLILKEPKMIVELESGEEVVVRGVDICSVGARVHVVHVEGNCNNGWHMPAPYPD